MFDHITMWIFWEAKIMFSRILWCEGRKWPVDPCSSEERRHDCSSCRDVSPLHIGQWELYQGTHVLLHCFLLDNSLSCVGGWSWPQKCMVAWPLEPRWRLWCWCSRGDAQGEQVLCEEVNEKIWFRDNLLDLFCDNSLIDKIAELANSRAHSTGLALCLRCCRPYGMWH